jgi:hydrogenase maturation protease
MTGPSLLIAGIGNIFFGDDAFGVEVARLLGTRPMPEGVTVRDFGIRGIDLMYALMDECDGAILIDALRQGRPAGTLLVIEPARNSSNAAGPAVEAHSLDPFTVLHRVFAGVPRCRVVRDAVAPAAALIEELIPGLLSDLKSQTPECTSSLT